MKGSGNMKRGNRKEQTIKKIRLSAIKENIARSDRRKIHCINRLWFNDRRTVHIFFSVVKK